jgi:hypothetical protein
MPIVKDAWKTRKRDCVEQMSKYVYLDYVP